MDKNVRKHITNTVFGGYRETVWVYLKSSNIKGSNYDPYRNTGYTITSQSPEPVEAYVRQIQGNSLIARELGLLESGAIEINIKDSDVNLFRICEKAKYDDGEYTPWNKALGNKIQIYKEKFGFNRVVLFRRYT